MHISLIHGFLERGSMWDPILKEIDAPTLTFELPGHGISELSLSSTMEAIATDFRKDLLRNGIDKTVLIGHSMGGYLACEFARIYPDMVEAIILFQSTASADSEEKRELRDRAIDLVQKNKRKYVSGMIRGLFSNRDFEGKAATINRLIEDACLMSAQAIVSSIEAMKTRVDSKEFISNRSFPLLYILGDEDPVIPLSKLQEEMKITQAERSWVLEKCGHMAQWEKAESASQAMVEAIDFIKSHSS